MSVAVFTTTLALTIISCRLLYVYIRLSYAQICATLFPAPQQQPSLSNVDGSDQVPPLWSPVGARPDEQSRPPSRRPSQTQTPPRVRRMSSASLLSIHADGTPPTWSRVPSQIDLDTTRLPEIWKEYPPGTTDAQIAEDVSPWEEQSRRLGLPLEPEMHVPTPLIPTRRQSRGGMDGLVSPIDMRRGGRRDGANGFRRH